ncbi:MAG: branched-chain amino acid ABC transporter permease [Fimbriimonadaceae bacterium]|nr:branched-chain amino acid ABC transporter permease [Fimbriimonadaceae bacterium]
MSDLLLQGLVAGARLALISFGFGLVYATTGIFHFAHGATYALAGYAAWLAIDRGGLPWPAALAIALAVAWVAGWLVEVWLYRPLRARRAATDTLFLTSLAAYTLVANLLALACGHESQPLGLDFGSVVLREGGPDGLPLVLTGVQLATVAAAGLLFGLTWLLLTRTPFGLRVRAVAANPDLAAALGIDSVRLLPQVVALGSLLGGVAACCQAADVGVQPQMGLEAVVAAAVAVVVGGVGSLPGTALAGLLLGLVRHSAAYTFGARWEDVLTFALLLVMLLLRPRGLFGQAPRRS